MKNLKRVAILFIMVAIFGNLKGQEYIHVKFSKILYNSNTGNIDFSVQFKAGEGYEFGSATKGQWGSLNLFFELYLYGTTLNHDGAVPIAGDATGNQNDITINTNPLTPAPAIVGNVPGDQLPDEVTRGYNMTVSRTNFGPNDLKPDSYSHIATFSIPVNGEPTEGTYFHIRTFEYDEDASYNGHTSNYSHWSIGSINYRPFKSEKEQYFLGFEPTGCPEQALWLGEESDDWHDFKNWVDPTDPETHVAVPCEDTEVYISGTALNFPMLSGTNRPLANNPNICKEITFFQGAQVGRIDLLTYEKARVQLNMYSPIDQVGNNSDFADFWKYSKYYSTPPLTTGQWHMLTMPLHGIVSGDLAYGGYPMTFVRKFNVQKQSTGTAEFVIEGSWMDFTRGTTETFSAAEGFAFYVYGGGEADKTKGFGRDFLSDWTTKPDYTGNHPAGGYGLGKTGGIIEFPTYDNPDKLQSHRTQKLEGEVSTFYDVYTPSGNINFDYTDEERYPAGQPTKGRDESANYSRAAIPGTGIVYWGSDYKFIGDIGDISSFPLPLSPINPPQTITQGAATTSVSYPLPANWEGDRDVLVGNPFMSALDFDAFYTANSGNTNSAMAQKFYRLWNGTEFVTYNCVDRTTDGGAEYPFTPYIAPMQGFFITQQMANATSLNFNANPMSTTSPNPINLRSSSEEERNIIRLSARNESGATTNTMIGQMENAEAGYKQGEDITKLFAPSDSHSHLSEIYTLADGTALAMNYIGESGAIVPIGIRVPASGTTTLKLKGMNRYDADKIELIDRETESVIADITGFSEFEHSFDNVEGGYQGGRFYLRIAGAITGMNEVAGNTIQVRRSGEAINIVSSPNDLIKQIHIYDTQGRVVYSNTSVDTDIYWVKEQFGKNKVLVVKVATENNTESVKIIMN